MDINQRKDEILKIINAEVNDVFLRAWLMKMPIHYQKMKEDSIRQEMVDFISNAMLKRIKEIDDDKRRENNASGGDIIPD